MNKYLSRLHSENKGFTLIELLIVIAILGVLAAIILPNFTGITGEGQTEAAKAELTVVQTAVDVMMARSDLSSVNATSATSDMSAFPTGSPLYPNYVRYATTKGTYSCTTSGLVTQESTGY